jgi:magnesium transporter
VIVDCAIYRDGRRTEGPGDFSDALDQARVRGGRLRLDRAVRAHGEGVRLVTEEFGLHPLAVEDALTAHQRPKLEVYDDSLFVVLKPVGTSRTATSSPPASSWSSWATPSW